MLCHYIHIYFVLLSGHQGRRSWAVQFMVQCFNNYRFTIARFRGRWSWREPWNWRLSVKSVVFSKIPRNITTFSFIRRLSRATDRSKNTKKIFSAWPIAHYQKCNKIYHFQIPDERTQKCSGQGLNSRPPAPPLIRQTSWHRLWMHPQRKSYARALVFNPAFCNRPINVEHAFISTRRTVRYLCSCNLFSWMASLQSIGILWIYSHKATVNI